MGPPLKRFLFLLISISIILASAVRPKSEKPPQYKEISPLSRENIRVLQTDSENSGANAEENSNTSNTNTENTGENTSTAGNQDPNSNDNQTTNEESSSNNNNNEENTTNNEENPKNNEESSTSNNNTNNEEKTTNNEENTTNNEENATNNEENSTNNEENTTNNEENTTNNEENTTNNEENTPDTEENPTNNEEHNDDNLPIINQNSSASLNLTPIYENLPERLYLSRSENRTFVFSVMNSLSSRKIALFVTPFTKRADPGDLNIYLTFKNSTPNISHHDIACHKTLIGFSSPCLINIPETDQEKPEHFDLKFTTVCDSLVCDLKLRVIHEVDIFLKPETKELYSFDREEAEIFSFEIPSNMSRVVLSVHFKNMVENNYEHRPNKPEEVLYFTSGEPMIIRSNYHVVALFNKSDAKLCEKCNVTFYITAKLNTVIEIEVIYYTSGASKIQLNHDYYDYISGTNPILYELDLTEEQIPRTNSPEKLFFTLNSVTGDEKILYVNGDANPYLLENFQFNSTLKSYYNEEDIILSRADIQTYQISGKKFFLAVKAQTPGLYHLETKLSIAPYVKLAFGVSESSVLTYMAVDYYELELWRTEEEEDQIEVKLINEKGNADLYGRICKFNEVCELITNQDIQDKNRIDFSSETEGNDQVKLVPKCPHDNAFCYILIAVRGYSLTTNLNKYSITVGRKNGIVNLLENKNHESHVEFGSSTKFKVIIDDSHKDIEKITIKVTANLPFYVSKNNECKNLDDSCTNVQFGDTSHPVVYQKEKDETFDGIYYIVVTGTKSTNFFILPSIHRKNKAKPVIKLSEGKVYRDIISRDNLYELFMFHISVETNTNIDINLQADRNKLEILVCDDEKLPDSEHYIWSSKTNFIRIQQNMNREEGKYEKIFKIRVIPIDAEALIAKNQSFHFGIVYSSDHTIKTLEKGQIFYESIKEDTYKFYLLFVDQMDQKVSFTVHTINPVHLATSLKLFISASPYPNYFTYNKTTFTDKETEKLTLTRENINTLCGSTNSHCPIYLSVRNNDKSHEITCSVLVEIQDMAVQLKEGYEQKFLINDPNFRSFFIPTHKDQDIDIFSYCSKEAYEMYVSVFSDKEHVVNTQAFESHYPSRQHSQYKSSYNTKHNIYLKTSLISECWPDCVVLISLVFRAQITNSGDFPVYILVSDDMVEFSEGKPLVFTLENYKVKYFSYDLMPIYKTYDDKAFIVVSVAPFYGKANIYLTVSVNDKNPRPTLKSYEFLSYADHIELTRSQLMKFLTSPEEIKSLKTLKLLICVYGLADSKLTLNIMSSKHVIPHLYTGMPQDILIKGGTSGIVQYYNSDNDVLRLILNRETGLGSLVITPCNPEIDNESTFEKCLEKNRSYFSIVTGSGSSYIRLSEMINPDFCKFCIYLITIKAVTDMKGSVLVSHPSTLISLQEGRKLFDEIEPNEYTLYSLYMQDFKEFEISATVFSGKLVVCFSYNYIKDTTKCDFKAEKNDSNGLIHLKIPPKYITKPGNNDITLAGDVHSHFNLYHIAVSSPTKSMYAISYLTNNEQILPSGFIVHDILNPTQTKFYLHRYYDLDAFPSLMINCQGVCHIKDLMIQASYKPLTYDKEDTRVVHLEIEPHFSTATTRYYHLPKEKANFEFALKNAGNTTLNYTIVVNGRDVSILPYDFNLQGVLTAKQSKYYEMSVPKKGYLALEMLDCFGESEILVSRDYTKVIKEEFDEEFRPLKSQPFIHLLKVTPGMIYMALINKKKDQDSAFEFNVHFYEVYLEIPQTRLSLGDTFFSTHDPKSQKLYLYVKPIVCSDCDEKELKSTNITYYGIVAENSTVLDIGGKCGIHHMPGSGLNFEDLEFVRQSGVTHLFYETNKSEIITLEIPFTPKRAQTTYFATVKAVVDFMGEKKQVNMYYPTIEIMIEKEFRFFQNKVALFIMGLVCLAIFFGCCLFGVYFYGKFKKIEKKLLYEVEDPKNITQVSGVNLYEPQNVSSIEMEAKTYQGLNET